MSNNKRDYSLDFLRIIACLMVVGVHTAMEGWYDISPWTYDWTVLNFYDTLGRPSIVLFFMISGSLFLRKKVIDIKRLWLKNILHIFVLYLFWVVFYAVMNNGIHKVMADPGIVWGVISGSNPQYHLWTLRTFICLYAIAPLLHVLVRAMDRKLIRYFLILFLLFGILPRTIFELPFTPVWIREQINLFVDMDLVRYSGYFILGYFLSDTDLFGKIPVKKLRVTYFVTLILAAGLNQWIAAADNWPTQALYGAFSLPVAIEAVCLFLLIRQRSADLSVSENFGMWIRRISESTLFVYLVHQFVIQRLHLYLHLYTTDYNLLFSVPVMVLIVFCISSAVGMILKKIPVINYLV